MNVATLTINADEAKHKARIYAAIPEHKRTPDDMAAGGNHE